MMLTLPLRISGIALVCLLATTALSAQQDAASARPDRVTILPFVNLSGAPDDAWIGAGIAESLVVEFQNRSSLVFSSLCTVFVEHLTAAAASSKLQPPLMSRRTASRSSRVSRTPRIRASAIPTPPLFPYHQVFGRRGSARWVVSGAYQRVGDQLRITGTLVDVSTGAVIRTAKIDGALDDLFALQDRLATGLVEGTTADSPALATAEPVPAQSQAGSVASSDAGPSAESAAGFAAPGASGAPPPPLPPEVINRDSRGRATVRATRVTEPIRLDGRLDEPTYQNVPAISNLVQQVPDEGAPASEKTEAWLMFDETNIYVSARLWDTAPPSEWVANEMRRDTSQLRENDTFWVAFDTFYDRRNAVGFYTNPLGAIGDLAITNEGNPNGDWNPVWEVRTGRFEGGWTVEMEIPFKSLRYRPGPQQVWGFQLRRGIRRKNETAYLTPIPISVGRGGIFRASNYATMVGLEVPTGGTNLEIKPYGIAELTTDVNATPPIRNVGDGTGGLDVKYGITQNLTADLTFNTDFAQVEVDEQQVNLTRFSLFFPEKREFFLEGQGIFNFARGGGSSGRNAALRQIGGGGGGRRGGGNAPTLFYSRRIGLEGGTIVPIVGGGRVTGKVGAFDVGALNIQAAEEATSGSAATNFTVVRVKRDILRRSSVGALFTNRSVSVVGNGSSQAYGADATFSFFDNVSLLGYVARTQTPGLDKEDTSYQGQFTYAGDLYGFQADHLVVEDNFLPEVGFLRRDNFRRSYVSGRFSPRPRSAEAIRQFRLEGSFDHILTANTGQLETRQAQLAFSTEFENSDRIGVSVAENYEFLAEPFEPGPGVIVPVGGYSFVDVEATYALGAQHRLAGIVTVRAGEYFSGNIRSVGFSRGRLELTRQLSIEPTLSLNWIDTPQGSFRTDLIVSRVNYTFTPRMFFSGLVQYNSATDSLSSNLRLRWEYSPGSELFVVYTEDRDTDPLRPDRYAELRNRGLVVKVNRLFRF